MRLFQKWVMNSDVFIDSLKYFRNVLIVVDLPKLKPSLIH